MFPTSPYYKGFIILENRIKVNTFANIYLATNQSLMNIANILHFLYTLCML
nr:MAG TPA: putative YhdX-like protein [Bacteriophage sp.]